jgi:hypothetical protein
MGGKASIVHALDLAGKVNRREYLHRDTSRLGRHLFV